jgi:hypothetical protein
MRRYCRSPAQARPAKRGDPLLRPPAVSAGGARDFSVSHKTITLEHPRDDRLRDTLSTRAREVSILRGVHGSGFVPSGMLTHKIRSSRYRTQETGSNPRSKTGQSDGVRPSVVRVSLFAGPRPFLLVKMNQYHAGHLPDDSRSPPR